MLNGPKLIALAEGAGGTTLYHMMLTSISSQRAIKQQAVRWTRVKRLPTGRKKMENQRWPSFRFLRVWLEKTWLKPCICSLPATGRRRSTLGGGKVTGLD